MSAQVIELSARCPYCEGKGTVIVQYKLGGDVYPEAAPCKRCRGTGKYVMPVRATK